MPPGDGLLAALYDSVVEDSAMERALNVLAEQFHCPSASIISFDAAVPEANVLAVIGTFEDPVVQHAYQTEWAASDPAPLAFSALPFGGVAATGVMFSRDFLRTCLFFNEFYRQIGLEECLGGNLSSRNGHFALIGLQRGKGRRPFTGGEVQALKDITPHLGRALQLRRAFARQGAKLASLSETIDRLAVGVIVLDHESGAIHVNRAAREIAARNDGLWVDRSGVPHAAQREADRALAKLCADVRAGGAGGIVRIPRRDDARPYAVLAAPLPARAAFTGTAVKSAPVLVLIHDPSVQVLAMPESIAAIFALPIATARLVAALAEGEDVKSYAEQHKVTKDAVKFHLKTAFAKTGLRSQTRLLQAVARALADLGTRRRE
jgi:GAF domain-containing protein